MSIKPWNNGHMKKNKRLQYTVIFALLCLMQRMIYSFFHLGKNSSVSSLYKNYTIACQNVTTEQVYFLVTNIDFLSVLVPVPFIIYR